MFQITVTLGWTDISSPGLARFLFSNPINPLSFINTNIFSRVSNFTSPTMWCTNDLGRLQLARINNSEKKKSFVLPSHLLRWNNSGAACRSHFKFWTKQGPTSSVSNIGDIAFYGCSEIIWTRNFMMFTVFAIIFGQLTTNFHF